MFEMADLTVFEETFVIVRQDAQKGLYEAVIFFPLEAYEPTNQAYESANATWRCMGKMMHNKRSKPGFIFICHLIDV